MTENQALSTGEVVQTFLQAMGAGDGVTIIRLMADDVVWTVPGNSDLPWVGRYEGIQAVQSFLADFGSYIEIVDNQVVALVVQDENAVLLTQQRLRFLNTGKEIDNSLAAHIVVQNGQITAYTVYEDTYAVSQAQA